MTTEVQITSSRTHMQYLRKVLSLTALRVGMDRRETEDLDAAVTGACALLAAASNKGKDYQLTVHLMSDHDSVLVDMADGNVDFDPICADAWVSEDGHSRGLDGIRRMVDAVELVRNADGVNIRLRKCARKRELSITGHPHQIPV